MKTKDIDIDLRRNESFEHEVEKIKFTDFAEGRETETSKARDYVSKCLEVSFTFQL